MTEVRGTVIRSSPKAAPLRALDVLKPGERARLSTDSRVGFFHAPAAHLYLVDGPAEVEVARKHVLANGKPVAPQKLDPAYRRAKVDIRDLVQATLPMRSAGRAPRVVAPEGVVVAGAERSFMWQGEGDWYLEIAAEDGVFLHRAKVAANEFHLPAEVALEIGKRYVWGVSRQPGDLAAGDWTEFAVKAPDADGPVTPAATASDSERLLYAAWLRSQGLVRAAARLTPQLANDIGSPAPPFR